MKKLYKCNVCGYVAEAEDKPSMPCIKCDASADAFVLLSDEETKKIYSSDETNDIFSKIITLASKMDKLSAKGIDINLDPNCHKTFAKIKDLSSRSLKLKKAGLV